MAQTVLSRIDAALGEALAPGEAGGRLKAAWGEAREMMRARRAARPGRGHHHAAELADATDLLVRGMCARAQRSAVGSVSR
jgi:hypothetical protein